MKGRPQLTLKILAVTPTLARELLGEHYGNRAVSPSRVRRYAHAMQRGEWALGAPLLFDKKGALFDGQHRLQAVIYSGHEVPFVAIYGFDRGDTFGTIDEVRPRQLRDWLHLKGFPQPETLAAAIRMAHALDAGRVPTSNTSEATPIELLDYFSKGDQSLVKSLDAPGTVSPLLSRGLSVFVHWALTRAAGEARANKFLTLLVLGHDEGPIALLRERLVKDRAATQRLSNTERLALIVKAWNAWLRGSELDELVWQRSGSAPEDFPAIAKGN